MSLPPGLLPGGRFDEWAREPIAFCVADVDGTLVGADNMPTPATIDAVRAAQGAGVPVGLATGRMRLSAEPIATAIGASGPHVLHNGAEVRSNGARVAAWPLNSDQVRALLEIGRTLGAYAEIYVDDGYVVTREDERALPHWRLLGRPPFAVIDNVDDLPDTALKATFAIFEDPGLVDAVCNALTELGLRIGPSHSPVTPGITYVNTTHPDADKGVALAEAAAHAGTDLSRTAAIGDAANDLPMLLMAGTAVAMGNTGDAVQAAAHLVAPPVESDGVATALTALLH